MLWLSSEKWYQEVKKQENYSEKKKRSFWKSFVKVKLVLVNIRFKLDISMPIMVTNPGIGFGAWHKPSIKVVNLSAWELDCPGWVLFICSAGVWGDAVSVCLGVVWAAEQWLEGVACGKDSLFGVLDRFCFFRLLEEWLLPIWRDTRDIGHWQTRIIPSFDGRTPLSTMIFMIRLQKGRHICAAVHPCFPHSLENVSANINWSSYDEIK